MKSINDPTAEDEGFEIYGQDSEEDTLTDFLTGKPVSEDISSQEYTPIDINFVMQGLPKLSVTYPYEGIVRQVTFDIGLNGDLKAAVKSEYSKELQSDGDVAPRRDAAQSAKALDICEDLGTLIEFLKT